MINKQITVILLLYKTPNKIIKNLKVYKNFDLIILDQSNDFILKKKLKKLLPNIKYYKVTKKNVGFAKGINFLVKKVKTKFFLCTQPDVLISEKSIIDLKRSFRFKKDCIISIPTFKNKNKKIITPIKQFIGAIFLSETQRFKKLNGFDNNFFFYWEDIDLSHRINETKFKIYLNSYSKATHLFGKSTSLNLKTYILKNSNFKFGEYLFQYKHQKLRNIKMIREPFMIVFKILFHLILFDKKQLYKNISHLLGIFMFYLYKLKN